MAGREPPEPQAHQAPEATWDLRLLGCPSPTWVMKMLRFGQCPRITRTSRAHEGLTPSPSGLPL